MLSIVTRPRVGSNYRSGAWDFASFEEGAYARARFQSGKTVWTRSVLALRADPRHPILVIRDTFAGDGARQPKVLTFNLMARGAVETPDGKVSPPLRRGDRPAGLSVSAEGNAVIVKSGTAEARIEPAEYSVKSGGRTVTRQLSGRDR